MMIVSCRKQGTSAHALGDVDRIYRIRPSSRSGSSLPGGGAGPDDATTLPRVSPTRLRQRVRDERILCLVHGYNAPFPYVRARFRSVASRIAGTVAGAYGSYLGFTWPAGASEYAYPWAKRRAKEAAGRLRAWIQRLITEAAAVDLLCYSMGNYLGHEALGPLPPARVRNVFAVAPALRLSRLQQTVERRTQYPFEHLYLLYSRNDTVLGRWFPLFEWDRAAGYDLPNDLQGMLHRANVTAVNCEAVVRSHTAYGESDVLYALLRGVLSADDGDRLPNEPREEGKRS